MTAYNTHSVLDGYKHSLTKSVNTNARSLPPLSVYKAWVDATDLIPNQYHSKNIKLTKDTLPRYLRNAAYQMSNGYSLTAYCKNVGISWTSFTKIFRMMPDSLKSTSYVG
jgi:hypothetical protein